MTTYTIHDLLYAKGTTEPVREMLLMLNDKAIKQEALIKELLTALFLVIECAGEIANAPDGVLEMALDDGDQETRRQANAFLVARAAIAKATGGAA